MQAPSRKWFVTQITAISAWLVAAINAGWDIGAELQIMAVGIVTQALAAYLIPNPEPEGD